MIFPNTWIQVNSLGGPQATEVFPVQDWGRLLYQLNLGNHLWRTRPNLPSSRKVVPNNHIRSDSSTFPWQPKSPATWISLLRTLEISTLLHLVPGVPDFYILDLPLVFDVINLLFHKNLGTTGTQSIFFLKKWKSPKHVRIEIGCVAVFYSTPQNFQDFAELFLSEILPKKLIASPSISSSLTAEIYICVWNIYKYIFMYICAHTYMYIRILVWICILIHISICTYMYIHIYICMYIYTYT